MAGKLKSIQIMKLPEGRHGDSAGLFLHVRGGSRSWFYRYTDADGKRREKSLGTVADLSLKEAREKRDEMAVARRRGSNFITQEDAADKSFGTMVAEAFEAFKGELKNEGAAGRWLSPINVHLLPKLRHRDVTTLTAAELQKVIAPIWHTKPAASAKAVDRLGKVLRYAAAKFPGEVDIGVVMNLRTLLGKQRHTVTHIRSMRWQDVPDFYATLGYSTCDLALRLVILTASRASPVRLMRPDEIEGDTWTVPAANMKGGADFRVPLSSEAMRVIDFARPLERGGYLFVSKKHGGKFGPISSAAITRMLDKRGIPARVHGFRSTFRSWAADTGQDWALAETSLDHRIGGKVERSYQRSDLLEQRRALMQEWADFVTSVAPVVE